MKYVKRPFPVSLPGLTETGGLLGAPLMAFLNYTTKAGRRPVGPEETDRLGMVLA